MRNSFLFIALLFLSGCSYIVAKPSFPTIPDILMEPCPELQEVSEKETRMSEFLKVVNNNYTTYYECKIRNDLFQKWYVEQKEAYKKVTE